MRSLGRGLASTVSALALFLFLPWTASACSCSFGPGADQPCAAYQEADAVFAGKVTGSSIVRGKPPHRVVHFAVLEGFAGATGTTIEINTGLGNGDCGYEFETGRSYFVYAWHIENRALWTGLCSATKKLAEAQSDLAFAGQVVHDGDRTRLYGRVVRSVRDDLQERLEQSGLGGVTVTAEGPAHQQLTTVTDSNGGFSFAGRFEGDFTVRAAAPEGLPAIAPRQVTVPAGRCSGVELESSGLASLAGRVVGREGRPVSGVQITLLPLRDAEPRDGEEIRTSDDGRYLFDHVPPGSYVLAVNPKGTADALKPPYPKTFFPRAGSSKEAERIVLRPEEARELPDFAIPPPAAARTITGVVRWPDGRPAAGIQVVLRADRLSSNHVSLGDKTDAKGRFKLTGYEGYTYTLTAMTKDASAQAEPAEVAVGGKDLHFELVLDPH
ncbi:MAG TPA: carboxypeptidase regulatory-like domain-containing protein [Thermoanaerobaculia bacterium]|jgi:5-hydroxyisourate hydrolase-like protein (transthyretin family)|nr:carboxypeptidase regulatory-like domain-containing protein [Thermoanaerobaculia bacterium]